MKSTSLIPLVAAIGFFSLSTTNSFAQKKTISRADFVPNKVTIKKFVPFTKADFVKTGKADNEPVKLPNKSKIPLNNYIESVNFIESNLNDLGIDKNRTEKVVLASRLKTVALADSRITTDAIVAKPIINKNASLASPGTTAATTLVRINPKAVARFTNTSLISPNINTGLAGNIFKQQSKARIEALPNENFERKFEFNPNPFSVAGYKVQLSGKVVLKGTIDPFFVPDGKNNNNDLKELMKATNNSFTAGLDLSVKTVLPTVGEFAVYKLESEFTGRSKSTASHSSKTKLTILQQVMINENKTSISADEYSYAENRLLNLSPLLGQADVFTYGLNILIPVDFYLNAPMIGANVDVKLTKTGISGTVGPRIGQSIIMESTLANYVIPGGKLPVDVGVGGELRLIEGGLDYGFNAGLKFYDGKLAMLNDMQADVAVDLLRGRLYNFFQYPMFTCNNIILQGLDLNCWEMRRVENDMFNTRAALTFRKEIVGEDLTKLINW